MKKEKKPRHVMPEVHILGDVEDVLALVKGLNKKNVIVVFKNEDQGTFHLEMKGKIEEILPDDITMLEKEFKIVYFSFFPGRKRVIAQVEPELNAPVLADPEGKKKKAAKEKRVEKAKKAKKAAKPGKEEHKKRHEKR